MLNLIPYRHSRMIRTRTEAYNEPRDTAQPLVGCTVQMKTKPDCLSHVSLYSSRLGESISDHSGLVSSRVSGDAQNCLELAGMHLSPTHPLDLLQARCEISSGWLSQPHTGSLGTCTSVVPTAGWYVPSSRVRKPPLSYRHPDN